MTSSQAAKHKKYWLQVVLDVPLRGPFDYWHDAAVATGSRVLVSFGRRKLIGIVTATLEQPFYDQEKVRPIEQVLEDLRSEEHTSELQSRGHLVCRLLLEKKK